MDEVEISFAPGLNTITGETGAGKSIMLGALGLVMGKRSDVKALADESSKCVVEAKYDVKSLSLNAYFEQNDLDYSDELIVRREVLPSGKSRAFINDSPVTLDVLQDLSEILLDIHQQFDTLELYKASFQINVLDALAGNKELLDGYHRLLASYKTQQKKLDTLEAAQSQASKEYDFVKYQLEEIKAIQLEDGEYEQLEEELKILLSAEDIKATASAIFRAVDADEQSISGTLADLIRQAQHLASKDKRFDQLGNRLESVREELKDIAGEAEDIFEKTEFDEARINFVQERIGVIHKLLKKHQMQSTEELLQLEQSLSRKLSEFDNLDEEIAGVKKETSRLYGEVLEVAGQLSERRKAVVPKLRSSLLTILSDLAMPSADFEVKFTHLEVPGEYGTDQAEFYFSANKGGKLQALKQVASGGETSRFALALKSIIAHSMALSTMLFDEIDTGVSGEVAHKMGLILKDMSSSRQIITITHSPQIASKGEHHLFVYKEEGEEKTSSKIKVLNREERIIEIAKMMSGDKPGEAAMENARVLLQG